MNRQDYEKLNNLAVSFEYFTSMIELAEHMTGEFICGNVTDDEEKARVHIVLSSELDAPAPCRLNAPDLDFACRTSADCLHQHQQVI